MSFRGFVSCVCVLPFHVGLAGSSTDNEQETHGFRAQSLALIQNLEDSLAWHRQRSEHLQEKLNSTTKENIQLSGMVDDQQRTYTLYPAIVHNAFTCILFIL